MPMLSSNRLRASTCFIMLVDIIRQHHLGVGGRGTEGSFISGIFTIDGFAGRVVGFIPPFARGISIAMFASLKFFSAISGALICSGGFTNVAATVGLFSASSL